MQSSCVLAVARCGCRPPTQVGVGNSSCREFKDRHRAVQGVRIVLRIEFHFVERLREDIMEDATMRRTKQASKRTSRKEVVPVLGAVGVSLSLTGSASAATAGPVPDVPSADATSSHGIILTEEEVADVSLGTFFVFDKENSGPSRFGEQYARGCGCRCGGCRGCGRGCRACRGCAGCGGCGCGGCGGCGCCLTWGVCRWC